MGDYLINIYIGLSQLGNAFLGGYPDESFSARSYRKKKQRGWRIAYKYINKIFFWQDDHCFQAFISEKQMKHLPSAYK